MQSKPLETVEREYDETVDALADMVWQFAYRGEKNGQECLGSGGLSALEVAFSVLGWDDPVAVHWVEAWLRERG